MAFKRKLPIQEVRAKFARKFIEDAQMDPEVAKEEAKKMSSSSIEQVQKDMFRSPKIVIINEKTGQKIEYTINQIDTVAKAKGVINRLARGDEALADYLKRYYHQGGFRNVAQSLLEYYFSPETLFKTTNPVTTFVIKKDGSLEHTESFDISEIRTMPTAEHHNEDKAVEGYVPYARPEGSALASISLTSSIKVTGARVDHEFKDINVVAHEGATKKFIEDPRNNFTKFLSWVKNAVTRLFSSVERDQKRKREDLSPPRRKL
ncbi:MAG: hypothetical protein AB7I18_05290 [Candidatus Berkiella sp.]